MNKKELIKKLIDKGVLKSKKLINIFNEIDRADFVLEEHEDIVYEDTALPIGFEQTISQPLVVVFMLELLDPKLGEKILDVGSGSGWTTALLAKIVGDRGYVYGREIIKELVDFGRNNLKKYPKLQAEINLAKEGEIGLKGKVPFDKVLVSASAPVLPQDLIDQLKIGGVMVIPIGNSIFRITKTNDEQIKSEEYPGFAFVPLKS